MDAKTNTGSGPAGHGAGSSGRQQPQTSHDPSSLASGSDGPSRAHRTLSDTAAEAPGVHGGYGEGFTSSEWMAGEEPSSTTHDGETHNKPGMGKRVMGEMEVLAGHVLSNPGMVLKGQEKKTGEPMGTMTSPTSESTGPKPERWEMRA